MAANRQASQGFATGSSNQAEELRRRQVSGPPTTSTPINQLREQEKLKIKKSKSFAQTFDEWEFIFAPILFTILAFFTRNWKIGLSPIVTWDEAHFGKFGSHYLKREFYFDVHPPLGKMLVGLSGYLAGYNGSFEFKSGERYPEELNYTFMRVFNSTFGALCVPVAYWTAKELHFRKMTVWFVTMMVLFENSYTTISRFILLDSMLLFFTFTTVLCMVKFHNERHDPFSPEWGLWLMFTGISIGCVCSVKWVGLFCTALVGLYTIEDLWNKFGDVKMPKVELAQHVGFRVFGLIVIPMAVYMFSFYLHFLILENSGPGDAQMSSLFQANLRGTEVGKDSPLEVAYGSRATIKNMGYGGGLLHSHVQTYPEGSQQQQITCYHHKDANNDWFFYPNRTAPEYNAEAEPRLIQNGDTIRLLHAQTGRNLHSHPIAAPVSKSDWEVSCYGNLTIGDTKDHWTLEVVDDAGSRDWSKIRTLTSAVRFKHPDLGCYLRAGNVNLPQWGFKQIEVTCVKSNNPRDKYTWWNIESHWNDKLPPGNAAAYRSPFLRDFIHLNVAMMTSNNALVPDPDKQDDLASKFWQWPLLNVGLRMCSWDDNTVKYFLLGNPLVYWGSTASLGIFALLTAWYTLRWQRGYVDFKNIRELDQIHYSGLYPVIGWFLHYLPFILMGRVTYVHHYYPALWFAIIVFGFCVDWTTRSLPRAVQWTVYSVLYVSVIGLFVLFKDISFGMQGSAEQWRYLKWFESWRITD
ncbi:PMT-domain-containing protein [Microthyrium microscopicum]|uniref:Dolichyl-phosphate-mannose--protein mannosyltransferase n=1 Tax=Microthyrium microscopicum TaxID=703497 RepID=A0A6A6UMA1_9PEZI|nr:PMT-domain-containing protein [Microthyrium microscopicum]